MTGLLVSVRSPEEAELALSAGVDLIDVKEPRRGALGAADVGILAGVLEVVGGRIPVSAALGELAAAQPHELPAALDLAKYGLAGCARVDDWPSRWREAVRGMPPNTGAVAVVYADWEAAQAPAPDLVLRVGAELGCRWLLVDTWQKKGKGLLEFWGAEDLARFAQEVRARQMKIVLAGSLSARTIPDVLELQPDYIAVRGAVCQQDRSGTLDGQRVLDLVAIVRGTPLLVSEHDLA